MFRLARVSVDVATMQFGPAVQIAVGGIQVIDKLHIGLSGEYLEMVSTHSDHDFITFLYRKVSIRHNYHAFTLLPHYGCCGIIVSVGNQIICEQRLTYSLPLRYCLSMSP